MSRVTAVHGRQVLDSEGYPTVEVEVTLASGARGRCAVPAGASAGPHEAVALRDGGSQWSSMGVTTAVRAVADEIAPNLLGCDAHPQSAIDRTLVALDGTPNKSRLGANALLATSLAVARAVAAEAGEPLWRYLGGHGAVRMPVPMLDVLNGGVHASNRLDFEEFMIVPAGASSFSEALRMATEVFHELRYTLLGSGHGAALGAGGGFAPDLASNEAAIETLLTAIARAGYEPGSDLWLGIDAAATELLDSGGYWLAHEGQRLTAAELVDYYDRLAARYPLLVLEDGPADEDWNGWQLLTARLGERVELCGDDLFATAAARLGQGIRDGVANAIVIKPNQVGTLTETLETISVAHARGYAAVIAHRAGETEDTTICDLAVATGSGQIKAGAPARERAAKYNRLLRIEEALGESAVFPGISAFSTP